jgi:replicative DNA helicase
LYGIKGTGGLENDADVVVFFNRDKDGNEPSKLEWYIAKNREGRLGQGELYFNLETQRIIERLKE